MERNLRMRRRDGMIKQSLHMEKIQLGEALYLQEQVKRTEDAMLHKRCAYVRDRRRFTKTVAPFKHTAAFRWQRGPHLGDGPLPTATITKPRDVYREAALQKYVWDSHGRRHLRSALEKGGEKVSLHSNTSKFPFFHHRVIFQL